MLEADRRHLLLGVLPAAPAHIADLGCGTGTLARLLVDNGYTVDGLDFALAMIERAQDKVQRHGSSLVTLQTPPWTLVPTTKC